MTSDTWVWNDTERQYLENGDTPVSSQQLIDLRDEYANEATVVLVGVTGRLLRHEINAQRWAISMRQALADLHGIQYLLGRGGRHAMQDDDWAKLSRVVVDQYGFLQAFGRQILASNLTEAEINYRAALYGDAGVTTFERARAAAHRLILPAYPGDGGTPCIIACRCHWTIDENDQRWSCKWNITSGDPCSGCLERAARYDPYVAAKAGASLE